MNIISINHLNTNSMKKTDFINSYFTLRGIPSSVLHSKATKRSIDIYQIEIEVNGELVQCLITESNKQFRAIVAEPSLCIKAKTDIVEVLNDVFEFLVIPR